MIAFFREIKALLARKKPVLVIAGPTASGKSALALQAAQVAGASVIINADSMQVYRAAPILTAQPPYEDLSLAPHRLYGFLNPTQTCSAAFWSEQAKGQIIEAHSLGRLPIVVGGTGLYLKTLLNGIAPIPQIAETVRRTVRDVAKCYGGPGLKARLEEGDPVLASRLETNDLQRLSRGLEVLWSTGRPLSEWQAQPLKGGLVSSGGFSLKSFVVERDRQTLYTRCEDRLDDMLSRGALDEVAALEALRLPPDVPILRAVGVPPLRALVRGDLSFKEATELAKRDTRRFAKRQLTWMRQQFTNWHRISVI